MASWLNALYDIFSQLSLLEHPRTVAQIRLQIYQSLKSDLRYEHVVRDIKRNTAWSIVKIRTALEAHASSINDLSHASLRTSHKAETKRLTKVAYHRARAALKSDDTDSDVEPEPELSRRAKKKAAKAKRIL